MRSSLQRAVHHVCKSSYCTVRLWTAFQTIDTTNTASETSSRLVASVNTVKRGALPFRVQHVKRRVLLSSSKAATGGAEAPGGAEEMQRERAEVDRSKDTAMLSALASGGSLNLSQELVLRDCCFKWKQGIELLTDRQSTACHVIVTVVSPTSLRTAPPHPTPPHPTPPRPAHILPR